MPTIRNESRSRYTVTHESGERWVLVCNPALARSEVCAEIDGESHNTGRIVADGRHDVDALAELVAAGWEDAGHPDPVVSVKYSGED